MNHKTTKTIASLIWGIGWGVLGGGAIASVIVAISAATIGAKLGFLLAGLGISAVFALILMALSKVITLLVSIDDRLSK